MKIVAALLIAGLLVLHQDYWQWNRTELVFGFLPHTIAWHAGLCLITSGVWVLITTLCWPHALEAVDSDGEPRP